ncbi:hypothetical protein SVIO_023320 [Streptomyces violaceusniger]|uniref:Uncharacterized protein n=1 Tax=Streptomyces violaceusniger TaxID=68280 RepID=A0A4D4L0Y7_STRVO|nr:hypothetical protein SVIO_023320 [Streptomyces violaceusniger]
MIRAQRPVGVGRETRGSEVRGAGFGAEPALEDGRSSPRRGAEVKATMGAFRRMVRFLGT